jgi:uncharacterized membrane protein
MSVPSWADYRKSLEEGADYASINDVDSVDDYYDNLFNEAFTATPFFNTEFDFGGEGGAYSGGTVAGSGRPSLSYSDYSSITANTPAYLKSFGTSSATVDKTQQAYSAVQNLTSTKDLSAALSSYYGYDISASNQDFSSSDFGGSLGQHTSSSNAELQQFHSLIEPILKDQVTYLQATKNLSYQDALMTAYQSDPMLQALYHKYDVKPVRQTSDGSSYLYDPFSFGEIRTFESKDPEFMDIASNVMVSAIVGSFLGVPAKSLIGQTALAGTSAGATAATMGASAATAQILGGDPLSAALFSGIPIGDIPIPGTGTNLEGAIANLVNDATYGADILLAGENFNISFGKTPLSMAVLQGLSGSISSGVGGSTTGATPDFNPYINNIAASVSGTTVEEQEERRIELVDIAALSQPEKAPVTPISQPEFDDITIDTTVEAGELPELEEDIAPPIVEPGDGGDGSSAAAAVGIDELKDRLKGLNPSSRQARAIRAILRKKTEEAMEAANKARIEQANAKAAADTANAAEAAQNAADARDARDARDNLEEEGTFFRIIERKPDGSVVVIDKAGNTSTLGSDQFGTDSQGRPILAGETYSEDKPERFDPSLFADFSRFSNVDVNPNGTYAWDGMTVSPERMEQIVNANPDQFPEPATATTEGTATDGTTTGDDATGDNGDGGAGGGNGGSGGGGGGGSAGGMFAGAGGAGKPSVTDLVFSDYVKRYEAPELQQRALPLQGYQAPQGLFRGLV